MIDPPSKHVLRVRVVGLRADFKTYSCELPDNWTLDLARLCARGLLYGFGPHPVPHEITIDGKPLLA